jgi:catechol 2,3-dioxygenase-like lactoylglutathione lyase family enzyme
MKPKRILFSLLLILSLCVAQELPISGLAHVGLRVSDIEKARQFYTGVLGFEKACDLKNDQGQLLLTFLKVNDGQYLELFPGVAANQTAGMTHVALLTPDIEKLRKMLEERSLAPGKINQSRDGNLNLWLKDPEGGRLEFLQYLPDSLQSKSRGKFLSEQRISDHLMHAGLPVSNLDAAMAFYRDQLGFKETLRGGPAPQDIRWINMLMPGPRGDYVEFMVYAAAPAAGRQHICLEVPDIQAAFKQMLQRGLPAQFKPFIGQNQRWLMNLRDPDGLRVELMEPKTAGQVPSPGPASSDRDAQDKRLAEIMAKRDRGEQVTAEEREFAQSIIERRNQENAAKRNQEYVKANPPRESTGLVLLTELGNSTYKGEQGGLYPGGENSPPPAHHKAGLDMARRIVPLDEEGRSSGDGKIVLLSIGMSNTTQEFRAFQKLAAADPELNPQLVIVDGAQGGQAADTTANPNANFWTVVDQRLRAAGVGGKQVQVVWLKQAIIGPKRPFPAEAKVLEGYLVDTLHNLTDRFPNLKIAYLSSRIYASYAGTPLNPEPHAYESAFAVKWVIAGQIAGKPELNYDPAKGTVRSPWLAWGPYLWADGLKGRKDGLVYLREDLGPDGTHPSISGREKVGRQLLDFLKKDPSARAWFVKK